MIEMPTAGEYRIDRAHSTISFKTRHIFGLAAVHGTFQLREGHIHVADPVADSSARATIAAGSVDTGLSMRDETVRSVQYLDAEHHPDITVVSTRLSQMDGRWTMHGSLTVRGRTRPLDVRVDEVRAAGGRLRLRATSRVDRYEFGITTMKGMTGRWLTMRLELTASLLGDQGR